MSRRNGYAMLELVVKDSASVTVRRPPYRGPPYREPPFRAPINPKAFGLYDNVPLSERPPLPPESAPGVRQAQRHSAPPRLPQPQPCDLDLDTSPPRSPPAGRRLGSADSWHGHWHGQQRALTSRLRLLWSLGCTSAPEQREPRRGHCQSRTWKFRRYC